MSGLDLWLQLKDTNKSFCSIFKVFLVLQFSFYESFLIFLYSFKILYFSYFLNVRTFLYFRISIFLYRVVFFIFLFLYFLFFLNLSIIFYVLLHLFKFFIFYHFIYFIFYLTKNWNKSGYFFFQNLFFNCINPKCIFSVYWVPYLPN